MYKVTKVYGHDRGLSAVFRKASATSHCQYLHGYSLAVSLEFSAMALDSRNWVVDFGGLKPVKAYLESLFDHKLLIARDDPQKEELLELQRLGLAQVMLVDATGCEGFAYEIFDYVHPWLAVDYQREQERIVGTSYVPALGLRLHSVTVAEHGANSATYFNPN